MQISRVASRIPSCSPYTRSPVYTGPPITTPAKRSGSPIVGRVNSSCPEEPVPNTTWVATRITTTMAPRMRKAVKERAHGAAGRRAATTAPDAQMRAVSTSGLVVREAAVASPSAQSHHAPGCSHRAGARTPRAGRLGGCIPSTVTVWAGRPCAG